MNPGFLGLKGTRQQAQEMTDNEDEEAPPWETSPEWICSNRIYDLIFDGRYDEAKLAIEDMRKEFPHLESHQFIRFYAALEERLGNPEKAIEMRQQAVREKPDHISHHYGLGHALIKVGRWAEADLAFQQVVALSIAADEFYYINDARYRRALCLKALGRKEELEKVKADLPDNFYNDWLYRIEDVT
jgi:tetratricopeptide (TPR) repeat protein